MISLMDIPTTVRAAFTSFLSDLSLLALPICVENKSLQPRPPIALPQDPQSTFQQALNQIEPVLNPKVALCLLLRHKESLVAVTFAPYSADSEARSLLLENRQVLIDKLGKEHFSSSIICKEIGEITDARSWDERSGNGKPWSSDRATQEHTHEMTSTPETRVLDLGHQKNKCRLCDRRMKNKITDSALAALKSLTTMRDGDFVQLSVNTSTSTLHLTTHLPSVAPSTVPSHLPTSTPSFTFYRHASSHRLYFIFCSPDSATVQERMKHTLAIPGLVNVIARDNGVDVDQKIEIHDPEELDFGDRDERIGKFRSMYLRNGAMGTESRWEGMEEQQRVLDAVE